MFVKTKSLIDGDEAEVAQAFSGTLTPDGIEDSQSALIIPDNFGNPNGFFILDNTGRVFKDGDGFSERIE